MNDNLRLDALRRDLEALRERDFAGGDRSGKPIPCSPDVLDDIGIMGIGGVMRTLAKHQIDAIRRVGELDRLLQDIDRKTHSSRPAGAA